MLKSIIAFGLTHRTIVIMGLLVFLGGGYVAFTNLNIEAYPNPARSFWRSPPSKPACRNRYEDTTEIRIGFSRP